MPVGRWSRTRLRARMTVDCHETAALSRRSAGSARQASTTAPRGDIDPAADLLLPDAVKRD